MYSNIGEIVKPVTFNVYNKVSVFVRPRICIKFEVSYFEKWYTNVVI